MTKHGDTVATALDADAAIAASASAPPSGDSHESAAHAMHQLAASALRSADAVADSPATPASVLPHAPPLNALSFSAASVAAMPRRFIAGLDESVTALVRRTARFAESPPTWYFRSTFIASLLIQAAFVIVLHWTDQSAFQSRPSAKTIIVSAVFQLLQVVWIAISSYRMVYFIIHDVVAPGVFVNMYLANVTMYAGLYVLIFMCDHEAIIFLDAGPLDTVATTLLSKVDLQIAFWYFSSTLMSTTGYGDILPMSNAAKTVAMAQLLTNCVYSLGLFSVGIEHFRQAHDAKAQREARNLARGRGDEGDVADGESGGSDTDDMSRDGREQINADSDRKTVPTSDAATELGATRRPRRSIDIVSVHVESHSSRADESDSNVHESIESSDRKSRISVDNQTGGADHDDGGSAVNDDHVDAGDGMCCFCCSCARFHALVRRLPQAPAWMISVRDVLIGNIFVVVLTLQLVQLLLVWMIDPKLLIAPTRGIQAAVVIAGCQLAQLVLIGLISFQLVRQINDKLVSANFLIQSYLSTTVVFAGIYFIVYALTGSKSFHIYIDAGSKFTYDGSFELHEVAYEFVWFSMVTMTTTGLGGCVPRSSLMRLLVALQQQVSIFYTVVILGMGMTIVIDKLGRLRKEALAAKVSAAVAAAAAAVPEVDQ